MLIFSEKLKLLLEVEKANNQEEMIVDYKNLIDQHANRELKFAPTVDFFYNLSQNHYIEIGKNVIDILEITSKEILQMGSFELIAEVIIDSHIEAVVKFVKESLDFCIKKQKRNISINIDFNIITRNKISKRLLVQFTPVLYSKNGVAMIAKGKYSDISHYKKSGSPSLCIIVDGKIASQNSASSDMIFKFNDSMITKQELEIIKQISLGYQSKEIASILNISKHTVYTHMKNIRNKTGQEITQIAISLKSQGLI